MWHQPSHVWWIFCCQRIQLLNVIKDNPLAGRLLIIDFPRMAFVSCGSAIGICSMQYELHHNMPPCHSRCACVGICLGRLKLPGFSSDGACRLAFNNCSTISRQLDGGCIINQLLANQHACFPYRLGQAKQSRLLLVRSAQRSGKCKRRCGKCV